MGIILSLESHMQYSALQLNFNKVIDNYFLWMSKTQSKYIYFILLTIFNIHVYLNKQLDYQIIQEYAYQQSWKSNIFSRF